MNEFATEFGQALEECGQTIEYCDITEGHESELAKYVDRDFKAIIGFQTYAFSIYLKNSGCYLHEFMHGPKFNFLFDHPIWMKNHIDIALPSYHILTHDKNYLNFIKKYYAAKDGTDDILPPAGKPYDSSTQIDKRYDVVFIGTYSDYRLKLQEIHRMKRSIRYIAGDYLGQMKNYPGFTAEESLEKVLQKRGLQVSTKEFVILMNQIKEACYCVMFYYREKVLKTLLDAEITVHVYGDSWRHQQKLESEHLVIHAEVDIEESRKIMSQARISLNIMAWHKGGFTERIANSMLCHSVVLSDQSSYLVKHFTDGEDMILFDLEELDKLPSCVKQLLQDSKKIEQIAECGYQKAIQEHTWKNRAKDFLRIVDTL